MKIEKLDHVAIQVKDLDKAKEFFNDLLGTQFSDSADFPEMDVKASICSLGIELTAPLKPDGPVSKAIASRGEGLSILSFVVPNLEEAMAEMKAKGIKLIGTLERPEWKAAIYHPKDIHGVMKEVKDFMMLIQT